MPTSGFGAGLESQRASVVAAEETVTDGRTHRLRRSSPDPRSSTWLLARRRWSGRLRSPSRAAVRKRCGSSCPTRPSDRWDRPGHGSAHRPVLGTRDSDHGIGGRRSPVLMHDRITATTDRLVERQPDHRGQCARSRTSGRWLAYSRAQITSFGAIPDGRIGSQVVEHSGGYPRWTRAQNRSRWL